MKPPSATGIGTDSGEFVFADRVGESVALARSLANHTQRIRSSMIDAGEGHNVLTFHGLGGVGKTKLSQRLERASAEAANAVPRRTAGWIFTDFAMELIGRPLPEVPTQWLEPVDEVRARYFALIDSIIERARNGQIVVLDGQRDGGLE